MDLTTSDCVLWEKARSRGYGVVSVGGKMLRAHRYAYELEHGPIPDGMVVMHLCDNPACINVDHLRVGTQADNMRDRDRKGRGHDTTGEGNGNHKLTERQVAAIREDGRTQRVIAAEYGITQPTVSDIKRGKSWI